MQKSHFFFPDISTRKRKKEIRVATFRTPLYKKMHHDIVAVKYLAATVGFLLSASRLSKLKSTFSIFNPVICSHRS